MTLIRTSGWMNQWCLTRWSLHTSLLKFLERWKCLREVGFFSKPWDILVPRSLSQPCRQSFCHVSPPEKLECPWINEWMITLFTAVSRKVVGKNVHATIPKGTMGYNQYTVPWHRSFQTYFRCFPLALGNIRPWPLMPFFQISLKKSELKTTHNTFRDCRVHFCDNLSWNSCIHG